MCKLILSEWMVFEMLCEEPGACYTQHTSECHPKGTFKMEAVHLIQGCVSARPWQTFIKSTDLFWLFTTGSFSLCIVMSSAGRVMWIKKEFIILLLDLKRDIFFDN